MNKLLDSFWRATMYCLHPRVMVLSILPVVIMGVLSLALGYFYWEGALAAVRGSLESFELVNAMLHWLEGVGLGSLRLVLAPVLLLFLAIPGIVIATLLFVSVFMTPPMVSLVASRRFPQLALKKGGSLMAGIGRSLGATLLAALLLVLSIPLWLVPPLVLILPPLIWGWLTYRVMSYDVLADHASAQEREQIFSEHRLPLLGIGVISGYLGAAPSLVWASGAMFVAMAPILVPVAIWIYTLVFAFSSLWFAHYCLAALEQLRMRNSVLAQASSAQAATDLIVDELAVKPLAQPAPGFPLTGSRPHESP
ncbi:MAG: putative transrane protein [Polaromonas sp.]|nr:putative transrane protein [Polaromonas sp.]